MRAADVVRLVVLAAIWGASFLFMRVAVGPLGAIATAEIRLVLAGATIALYLAIVGKRLDLGRHWRHYAIVGILNSAAPFVLYAWSAQHLPASYLAVINATAPLFGALVAALWLGDRITPRAAVGLEPVQLGMRHREPRPRQFTERLGDEVFRQAAERNQIAKEAGAVFSQQSPQALGTGQVWPQ